MCIQQVAIFGFILKDHPVLESNQRNRDELQKKKTMNVINTITDWNDIFFSVKLLKASFFKSNFNSPKKFLTNKYINVWVYV